MASLIEVRIARTYLANNKKIEGDALLKESGIFQVNRLRFEVKCVLNRVNIVYQEIYGEIFGMLI